MKKILGISLVAVLAVSPMMAMAEGELGSAVSIAGQVEASGAAFTTQSYVKGAYNAVESDLANVNAAVTKLNANDQTTGSVLKAIKDNAANASYSASTNYAENTIGAAIKNAISVSGTSAGAGLSKNTQTGVFSVNVDNATIEVNGSDNLQVKAGSIGATQLSSDVNTSLGKADSAVQSVATGSTGGTIAVDNTEVAVATDSTHRFVTDDEKSTWSGKQDELSATNQLDPAYIATDANNAFVTEAEKTSWNSVASAVSDYTNDLAAKQDKSDSTVSAEQATAHTILNQGAGVAGNLVNLAGGIEAIDDTQIPVATGWANGANGADTVSNLTISSLRD